ncbi:MAG: hypothetical protein ABS46_10995 [Cytophagaceae bacterium SCN 52-12]|nr:MAG: hypothetical protein ABS46_10995 [Cytophagaceae bacterium SCN 52-12]
MTTVNCLLAYTIYPNPAKDYITIEFEKPVNAEGLPDEIVLYSDKSTIALRTINVQELLSQKAFINGNHQCEKYASGCEARSCWFRFRP